MSRTAAVRPLPEASDSLPSLSGHSEERRVAKRRPAALVPSITKVRLSPTGGDASLLNISTTGVLLKINLRLMPGTNVTVNLEGTFRPSSIAARVVRCNVSDIDSKGVLWYQVGFTFKKPIVFEDEAVEPASPRPGPVAVPALSAVPAPHPRPTPSFSSVVRNRW